MNNKNNILALRYASAFLNVYYKEYAVEDFYLIQKAALFFKNNKKACFFMQLSALDKTIKKESLSTICHQLSLPLFYEKLFLLLIEHKRLYLLPLVFDQLAQEYQKRASYIPMDISTTTSLDEEEQRVLLNFLKQHTHKTILPHYLIDESLIAGIRAISSSYLFEKSIKSVLRTTVKKLQ